MTKLRVGVDSGGTFTDFVLVKNGRIRIFKERSTPHNPAHAILNGLATITQEPIGELIHGSTVATNTLLERKGARTALVTTEGFEDILVIGRQARRELYNIFVTGPSPIIPDGLRIGVRERIAYDGSVQVQLTEDELCRLSARLKDAGIESVAVSLLFSFANPKHERAISRSLQSLGVPISLSSEILPEYREYERTSTTVVNGYLAPRMSCYLRELESSLNGPQLRVMQSNGGSVHARRIADRPVHTILSGPAAGVVGAFRMARASGYSRIITFDMGGTSTDVSLCDGDIKVTRETHVDNMPVAIPMLDIHTVGAGGGSIASFDVGGSLKVGPESVGAEPGPICYGKGSQITVTDANILLGRLLPEFFLGGQFRLQPERIAHIAESLAWTGDWPSLPDLAQGIVDVVNNNMEQAIRLVSVERGHDPRDFVLFCFGGAGGLHAAHLARGLGIPKIVVPPYPGALSAVGLLLADARKDYSQSMLQSASVALPCIRQVLSTLHAEGLAELRREGFRPDQIRHLDFVDARYSGQSYELTVPFTANLIAQFHRRHQRRYGYSNRDKEVEIVNVRTTVLGRTVKPEFRRHRLRSNTPGALKTNPVWFDGKCKRAAVYDRESLSPGAHLAGPAIIGEYSSTTLVPPGFFCRVDPYGNLILEQNSIFPVRSRRSKTSKS